MTCNLDDAIKVAMCRLELAIKRCDSENDKDTIRILEKALDAFLQDINQFRPEY